MDGWHTARNAQRVPAEEGRGRSSPRRANIGAVWREGGSGGWAAGGWGGGGGLDAGWGEAGVASAGCAGPGPAAASLARGGGEGGATRLRDAVALLLCCPQVGEQAAAQRPRVRYELREHLLPRAGGAGRGGAAERGGPDAAPGV